ncbi:uncharacterized protein LOC144065781 [Stigmatopora argus]
MGCRCCRMVKSYISEEDDVGKRDSVYRTHELAGGVLGGRSPKEEKEGFRNLAYSISGDSSLSLGPESDRHRPNRGPSVHRRASAPPAEDGIYVIRADPLGPRWVVRDGRLGRVPTYPASEARGDPRPRAAADDVSADEGVGGTPEFRSGDEESVSSSSADAGTGTGSSWSADTGDERGSEAADASTVESGIGVTKSEDEDEGPFKEAASVTESMVAEALAALEAATAGEEEDE